jgi:hypothetical protein
LFLVKSLKKIQGAKSGLLKNIAKDIARHFVFFILK